MKSKHLKYDYIICEDELTLTALDVEPLHRRQGIATSFLKELELMAKERKCKIIYAPSDLSKIALSFWLKSGYVPVDSGEKRKIDRVLNSKKDVNFIFDMDDNSVVQLFKKI